MWENSTQPLKKIGDERGEGGLLVRFCHCAFTKETIIFHLLVECIIPIGRSKCRIKTGTPRRRYLPVTFQQAVGTCAKREKQPQINGLCFCDGSNSVPRHLHAKRIKKKHCAVIAPILVETQVMQIVIGICIDQLNTVMKFGEFLLQFREFRKPSCAMLNENAAVETRFNFQGNSGRSVNKSLGIQSTSAFEERSKVIVHLLGRVID